MQCLSHGGNWMSRLEKVVRHHYEPESFASKHAQEVVRQIILPAVFPKEYRNSSVAELAQSLEAIKRRLSNLTIIGVSCGTVFAKMMENALRMELRMRGFKDAEVSDILQSVVLINIANVARLDGKAPGFVTLSFAGVNDEFVKKLVRLIGVRVVQKACSLYYRKTQKVTGEMVLKLLGYHGRGEKLMLSETPNGMLITDKIPSNIR